MLVKALVENTCVSPEYRAKHGLSLYIETPGHKILFDLGPNDSFLRNAQKMNVDIGAVDTVIISHGHSDHGGALKLFLERNKKAKIYIRENAFENHTTKVAALQVSISLDRSLMNNPQIILTKEQTKLDDELFLFSDIKTSEYISKSNAALFMKKDGIRKTDDFTHEQNLIITAENKTVLFAGCAHRGIVNIMNREKEITDREPDICIGGFHLYNPVSKKGESKALVESIADELKKSSTVYYTCHCTGKAAFDTMKSVLADRLFYLSAGGTVEI